MKMVSVYGVEMTSIDEMMFSRFLSLKQIAPNTMTPDARRELVEQWLKDQKP